MEPHNFSDQIILLIASALVVAILLGVFKVISDKRDTNTIIAFLKDSEAATEDRFRSNHAIASDTNLSEERVRKLCSKTNRIRRNPKEKESWCLA